jgi:hypothetical protein
VIGSEIVSKSWTPEQRRTELEQLAAAAPTVDLDAAAGAGNEEDGWPTLILGEQPPVPPFPTDTLPQAVADFVRRVAGSIGCPEDIVGLGVIVTAGAAIGRSAALLLKRGYFASASLYGVAVGNPSSGKSPALDAATRPMWEIDERYHDAYRVARDRFQEQMEAYKNTPKDAPKPPKPKKPVLESVVIENATVEALAPLLAINPRGLLVARDELSAWVGSFDQYRSGGRGA